jgi:CRISPR/Cas system-associated exonuclease Cas4 (RecB family)
MPAPEMPDGVYVSVSQLKTYLRCARQFELKYVRGISPAFVPVPLAFGSAFHEALAAYYSELKLACEVLRRDLLLDVFRSAWERASSGPVPLQDDEEDQVGGIVDKGVSMLHAFYAQASTVVAGILVEDVEKRFAVHVYDADTGEVLEEQLVGTMDLIVNDGGRRVVVEHKSSARKYGEDQLRWDFQPTAYKLAARELGLGEVDLRFQVITKTKVPTVQVVDIERGANDEEDFLRTAAGVLRAIDAGVSYPVRGWQCRSCPYSYACTGSSRATST